MDPWAAMAAMHLHDEGYGGGYRRHQGGHHGHHRRRGQDPLGGYRRPPRRSRWDDSSEDEHEFDSEEEYTPQHGKGYQTMPEEDGGAGDLWAMGAWVAAGRENPFLLYYRLRTRSGRRVPVWVNRERSAVTPYGVLNMMGVGILDAPDPDNILRRINSSDEAYQRLEFLNRQFEAQYFSPELCRWLAAHPTNNPSNPVWVTNDLLREQQTTGQVPQLIRLTERQQQQDPAQATPQAQHLRARAHPRAAVPGGEAGLFTDGSPGPRGGVAALEVNIGAMVPFEGGENAANPNAAQAPPRARAPRPARGPPPPSGQQQRQPRRGVDAFNLGHDIGTVLPTMIPSGGRELALVEVVVMVVMVRDIGMTMSIGVIDMDMVVGIMVDIMAIMVGIMADMADMVEEAITRDINQACACLMGDTERDRY
ncbi:MAG: hypothetical protein M1816_006465 [Peltula sp. TS41687]|nr:MAG: hypothetical protein M1816_006465 [Peltula sp. TS41687]